MAWLFLISAVVFEVTATVSLRIAAHGKKLWFLVVGAGYLAAFGFLSLTLGAGMGLGVAYGIWAASGVVLTAMVDKFLFNEAFTWIMAAGIALVVIGVLLVEFGTAH